MSTERTGVLLLQLGTPDEPTIPAVRRYLREFLGDRRVIEAPRFVWWFVLNFIILRNRPADSADKYQRIWDPKTGSPLRYYTERQVEGLRERLPGTLVRYAMRYGTPAIPAVLREMLAEGVERLVAIPLYPQYSATSSAAALDPIFQTLTQERRVPSLVAMRSFPDHPAYIEAMATIIEYDLRQLSWQPEHYLLSFHGIPVSYVQRGDPYPDEVARTTRKLIERLGWPQGKWTQTYQSRFGKEPWLEPYTDDVLAALAKQGTRRVFVASPGFAADCLETIDEIGREFLEVFEHAGGEQMRRCPCLNDHPVWLDALARIVRESLGLQHT